MGRRSAMQKGRGRSRVNKERARATDDKITPTAILQSIPICCRLVIQESRVHVRTNIRSWPYQPVPICTKMSPLITYKVVWFWIPTPSLFHPQDVPHSELIFRILLLQLVSYQSGHLVRYGAALPAARRTDGRQAGNMLMPIWAMSASCAWQRGIHKCVSVFRWRLGHTRASPMSSHRKG